MYREINLDINYRRSKENKFQPHIRAVAYQCTSPLTVWSGEQQIPTHPEHDGIQHAAEWIQDEQETITLEMDGKRLRVGYLDKDPFLALLEDSLTTELCVHVRLNGIPAKIGRAWC